MDMNVFASLTIEFPKDEAKRRLLGESLANFLDILREQEIEVRHIIRTNQTMYSLAETASFTLWEVCRQFSCDGRAFCHTAQTIKAELTLLHLHREPSCHRGKITTSVNAHYDSFERQELKNPCLIARVEEIVNREYRSVDLTSLAQRLNVTCNYLSHAISENTGCTYGELVLCRRLLAVIHLFSADQEAPMEELAFTVGYASVHYFTRVFKRFTGQTPANIRRHISLLPSLGRAQRGATHKIPIG